MKLKPIYYTNASYVKCVKFFLNGILCQRQISCRIRFGGNLTLKKHEIIALNPQIGCSLNEHTAHLEKLRTSLPTPLLNFKIVSSINNTIWCEDMLKCMFLDLVCIQRQNNLQEQSLKGLCHL